MNRPILSAAALVLMLPLLTVGCASVPADRGRGDVASLLKERGQEHPVAQNAAAGKALIAELAGRPLTAQDAVRLALLNNPGLKGEYARLGFAAGDVYEAGRLSNPTFSASVMRPSVAGESNVIGLGIAQSFTNLLMLPARSRFAEGEFERVKQLVGARVLDLAADTEAAWFQAAGAEQLLAMREIVGTAADAAAELAQRFFDAGNINRLELSMEQAAASQARLDVMQAQAERTAARSRLNRLMGLTAAEVRWTLAEGLPTPVTDEDDPATLLKLADESRLDLAAARKRVSLQADALGVTRRFRFLGEVELGLEIERETDGSRLTGPTLALELPLFNQGQGRIAHAQAALEEAEAELRSLEIEISNGVQLAAAEVAAAKARVEHYRKSLIPLREIIVARTLEEVNYMLEGQFQLLVVKQQEYEAYQGYLESVRDYWLARVELGREVGTSLPSSARIGKATLDAQSLTRPKGSTDHDMHKGMDHSGHEMADTEEMDHSGHNMDDMKQDHQHGDEK